MTNTKYPVTESSIEDALLMVFDGCAEDSLVEHVLDQVRSAWSFEHVGVMTSNAGLVVSLADGSEYQITIVQSRRSC